MQLSDRIPAVPADALDVDFQRDLLGSYARLRAVGPVAYFAPARAVLVTGYAEVAQVLRDPVFAAAPHHALWEKLARALKRDFDPVIAILASAPFALEGRRHRDLREAFAKGLSVVSGHARACRAAIDAKLAALGRRGGGDLAADFGRFLLSDIVCDMMQIPTDDRPAVHAMADKSIALDRVLSLAARDQLVRQAGECLDYLHTHVRTVLKRARPPFLAAVHDALPAAMPDREKVTAILAILLLVMGNDALNAVVAMGVQRLLDPQDPGPPQAAWAGLADDAIRFTAPVFSTMRIAAADAIIGGCPVPRGAAVIASTLAANHDPQRFGERHGRIAAFNDLGMAFGAGRHQCVGMRLTRELAKETFAAIAALPRLSLAGPAIYRTGNVVRTVDSLPVEFS